MSDKNNQVLVVGIDVGSTTVKMTVVDSQTKEILWSDYRRHETKQAEKVLEFLVEIGAEFSHVPKDNIQVFITGSGGAPLAESLGAKFVQEVNAVTMACESLHPDAGSVIELGGQDAKIIIYKENKKTGEKNSITSMNDKCASGTGATIDKCMIKVGLSEEETSQIKFDATKLHHVAAKCGVFAETDIVNLVKTGISSHEILNSLADAIVQQNISVLTRGNTLRHKVILLGGPNCYLPFLQECWRMRIPEVWEERGYEYPKDVPIEDLIIIPENSLYYAAYGAVLYGLEDKSHTQSYRGLDFLKDYIQHGRQGRLGEIAGAPLVQSEEELEQFLKDYKLPKFSSAKFSPGQVVKGVVGTDGGSTSSKCVLISQEGEILLKEYQLSKGNPIQDMKEMMEKLKKRVEEQGATLEIIGLGCTGYAADVLSQALNADVNLVETVAHMRSAMHYYPEAEVVCDIGGQDIKVLMIQNEELKNFKLSNQCSAGNGMILQAMADQFGVPVQEYAENAFRAPHSPKFSYGCAVFLDSDRVNFQKEGFGKEELMAGLAMVLPKNVWQYVVQVPRMSELGSKFVLQGGTQYNLAAVKAQVDYIKQRVPGAEVWVHPHPGEAGAIGVGMEALRVVKRKSHSTFVGLQDSIDISYTTKNDDETRCYFCPNHCSRTFIDTVTPGGTTARYISGFSCEKGMVESKEELARQQKELNEVRKKYPNLVNYEARNLFKGKLDYQEIPKEGCLIKDQRVKKSFWGIIKTKEYTRPIIRSNQLSEKSREQIRIGMPKCLNMWSTAPFFRAYFEVLGIEKENIIFSADSGEEMFAEGGKYGSVDPCYPSKVSQAHIHDLLFDKHREDRPLHYIYFPALTNVPTFLHNIMDSVSCPIVAGTPEVMKAAFTKEIDFFSQRGIDYVSDPLNFSAPLFMKDQMYQTWKDRLGVTRDESDWAVSQALKALEKFDLGIQTKGRELIEQLERDNKIGIVLLGRPYHLDPGLHHQIPDEFQGEGYPILSMRSLPRDPQWLKRFFDDKDPLDINDVWPENFSANSAQKVWAAKFAARHPNLAILDLSSFKCGHDAPTYGIVDRIVATAKAPYSALHDIDANRPGGSIKIRVKTYTYALGLRQEKLEDLEQKRIELEKRIEEKRRELSNRKFAQAKLNQLGAKNGQTRDELRSAEL